MWIRAGMTVLLLVAGTAQAVTLGFIPTGGGTTRSAGDNPLTIINVAYPALEAGSVTTATVKWTSATASGCTSAFRIKFLRSTGSLTATNVFVVSANRGPFDAVNGINTVSLTPAVAIQEGDLIAVTQLKPIAGCGAVANYRTDLTTAYMITATDAATGTELSALIDSGTIPAVRASSDLAVVHAYIPVVGSLTGSFGSQFKTGVQLTNFSRNPSSGRLVFHPAGAPGSSADPSVPFTINGYLETLSIDDVVVAAGRTGLGSMDVVTTGGAPPDITVRVYDDQGTNGTDGFTEDLVTPWQVLRANDIATITTPPDLTNFRLNIGVRSLSAGARLVIAAYSQSGDLQTFGVTRTYLANFFEQIQGSTFLGGLQVPVNGIIEVFVDEGSAIVYGATTDNRTNDARLRYFVRQ